MNQYEELRASALGETNRAGGMLLFLKQGMGRWMSGLKNENFIECKTSLSIKGTRPDNGVAAILADAVLETA